MVPDSAAAATGAPHFASTDPGFDALPVEQLLVEHAALLGRIKLCYGADRATFERDLMPLMRRYAAYVHLLPATPDNYFRMPGGLLRLGLETAFFALQGTDAHIYSGKATITARRELEPRWRVATFVGGLCCELHRVLSHLIATTPEGEEWPSFLMPLSDWLRLRSVPRYFVRWRPRAVEVRGLGLFVLPLVVPAAMLEELRQDDGAIVRQLLASVGGVPQYREHNVLDDLVRRSLALVVDRNLSASADRYGSPQYGSHLERYLVDALRRLAAGHSAWAANRDRGRMWFGEDGVFLIWPAAAQDVLELLEGDQLAGIPKAPDTLLDILIEAGVFEATPDGKRTWPIFLATAKTAIEAVKLSSPSIVLSGIEPAPVAIARPMQQRERETSAQQSVSKRDLTREPAPRVPTAPAESPQLSLIDADEPVSSPIDPPAPTERVPAPAPDDVPAQPGATSDSRPFHLKAPMRLNPAVRQALQDALDTLNDTPALAPVFTVHEGVFVPLVELERRGLQPAVALRSLLDAGMLYRSKGGPPTRSLDVRGVPTIGVVLLAAHVDGIKPRAVADGHDAGA